MHFIGRTLRLCGAVVTAAVFLAGLSIAPGRAADDLPIVGDLPMPEVHVNVDVDGDFGPPPRPRPHFAYPRGPFAAIRPGRFDPPMAEGPGVPPPEVARMLRSTGFSLLGQINRRGWVYTVAVINPRGDDGRAIIDARTGAILRFIPAYAVNARLDDQLGALYGPPGPPPVVEAAPRGVHPPRALPKADMRKPAPKLAARTQVNSPPTQHAKPADAHAEMKPASAAATTGIASNTASPSAPPPETPPPGLKLWPTQAMPDVQTFE